MKPKNCVEIGVLKFPQTKQLELQQKLGLNLIFLEPKTKFLKEEEDKEKVHQNKTPPKKITD